MQNIEIKARTPIETLRKAGIVPDWMARDCELHGMSPTTLSVLSYSRLSAWSNWEDGWDLGDDYDKSQLEVLAKVRSIIHEALGY